jgi:hypothetical protein
VDRAGRIIRPPAPPPPPPGPASSPPAPGRRSCEDGAGRQSSAGAGDRGGVGKVAVSGRFATDPRPPVTVVSQLQHAGSPLWHAPPAAPADDGPRARRQTGPKHDGASSTDEPEHDEHHGAAAPPARRCAPPVRSSRFRRWQARGRCPPTGPGPAVGAIASVRHLDVHGRVIFVGRGWARRGQHSCSQPLSPGERCRPWCAHGGPTGEGRAAGDGRGPGRPTGLRGRQRPRPVAERASTRCWRPGGPRVPWGRRRVRSACARPSTTRAGGGVSRSTLEVPRRQWRATTAPGCRSSTSSVRGRGRPGSDTTPHVAERTAGRIPALLACWVDPLTPP